MDKPLTEIVGFTGEYRWLSNFCHCPFTTRRGTVCQSVEHGYQACKTTDALHQKIILDSFSATQAAERGRRVALRPDWAKVRVGYMRELLRCKFADSQLRRNLLKTGNARLVHLNYHSDTFWGCVETSDGVKGKNMLGRLLMEIREEIRKQEGKAPSER